MKYYSEETVKKMMLKIAHTALEQRAINNGDVFFRQPSIELPDKHGRLANVDTIISVFDLVNSYGGASGINYKSVIDTLQDEVLVPTVVEATE